MRISWDLGLSNLLPEWKRMLGPSGLKEDVIAGATVACVAVPLSLAIALASDVPPAVGLVTAIIAGIVCGFFGGTPLAVSGPAAAMSVLIASNVERFGLSGLLLIGLGCGVLQLAFGVFGLGRLIRFVPSPVVTGFTAGIGVIILIGQLPRALGLPAPDQNHTIEVVKHLFGLLADAQWKVVALAMTTFIIVKMLPKFASKLPAPLIGVAVPTALVYFFSIDVPLVGAIPRELPAPSFPTIPTENLVDIAFSAIIVFSLASLETLLSSSSVDKLTRTERHDPDQELIGQGLGNLAVAFFGGIPVTGVIARSALNVKAGAKSRRAAIIHSLFLLAIVYAVAPVISQIPIAALAGMLIAVATSMINVHEFRTVLKVSKGEAAIYGVTFFAMVFVDLIAGVQAGFVAALVAAALRLGQLTVLTNLHNEGKKFPVRATCIGPITFLSSSKLQKLQAEILSDTHDKWILDFSKVSFIDSSGAEMIVELTRAALEKKIKIAFKGVSSLGQSAIHSVDSDKVTEGLFALTEYDVAEVLDSLHEVVPRERLTSGVSQFQREVESHYSPLFEVLKDGQRPHTLFITCCDSRIVPNLMTSTEPGELFIVRNVGNVVPRPDEDSTPAEGAAIEYAVNVLEVAEIIVCGHFGCGAIAASISGVDGKKFEHLSKWLGHIKGHGKELEDVVRTNVLSQIENVLEYTCVKEAVAAKKLQVRGWVYDLKRGGIWEWDHARDSFEPLGKAKEVATTTVS